MLVKIIRSADDVISIDLAVTTLKQILSGLELHYGKALIDSLISDGYRYVLINSANPDQSIALDPAVAWGSLDGYDMLVIVRDIDGDIPAVAIWAAVVTAATEIGISAGIAVALGEMAVALVNIGLSMALNAVMSLLSPTPEFSSDPGRGQRKNSNLFNGSELTREQGGIVPIIMGHPYCSGVLISSGISTEDY